MHQPIHGPACPSTISPIPPAPNLYGTALHDTAAMLQYLKFLKIIFRYTVEVNPATTTTGDVDGYCIRRSLWKYEVNFKALNLFINDQFNT